MLHVLHRHHLASHPPHTLNLILNSFEYSSGLHVTPCGETKEQDQFYSVFKEHQSETGWEAQLALGIPFNHSLWTASDAVPTEFDSVDPTGLEPVTSRMQSVRSTR